MGWINQQGQYYEGDGQPGDIEVLDRPSALHVWQNGAWVLSPTAAQIAYSAAGQELLDSTAQAWSYNDMATAASYLNSTIAQFKAEATALCTWRDNFWYQAGLLEAQIKAGTATLPISAAAFLALMPPVPTRPMTS